MVIFGASHQFLDEPCLLSFHFIRTVIQFQDLVHGVDYRLFILCIVSTILCMVLTITFYKLFISQINCDGGFKFNDYPVKFTDMTEKKTKELIMTIEMPLNASEILYGPIHLSWQVGPKCLKGKWSFVSKC